MNTHATLAIRAKAGSRAIPTQSPPQFGERRARDFGIGYGNSSGYASSKRYTQPWGSTRFVMG